MVAKTLGAYDGARTECLKREEFKCTWIKLTKESDFILKGSAQLVVKDLRVWVHLGCNKEEKHHPQMVSFSIYIDFKNVPKGAKTDSIEDTVCYLDIVRAIKECCQSQHFNLIEHLTESVLDLMQIMPIRNRSIISTIKIETCKLAPPVPGVQGGVVCTRCISFGEK